MFANVFEFNFKLDVTFCKDHWIVSVDARYLVTTKKLEPREGGRKVRARLMAALLMMCIPVVFTRDYFLCKRFFLKK